jgi:hypothetical protein
MGRVSHVHYLSPEDQTVVDACIRHHKYVRIDVIRSELLKREINISRSALHRYMVRLQENDGFMMDSSDATIVTIMERSTGRVVVVKTPVKPDALVAHLQTLTALYPVS